MSTGPALWVIMTVGGAILLGVAMTYGLISTRNRRENPVARRLTDAATREVYREEEARRMHQEGGAGQPIPESLEEQAISATEARQAVSGHNVNVVLIVSLILAAVAGMGLLAYVWIVRG